MKSEDGYDGGGRESRGQEPWEPQEGPVAANDAAEAPDGDGQGEGKKEGGGELGHGDRLSGPLERRIVKN